jgi:hypothetical protein
MGGGGGHGGGGPVQYDDEDEMKRELADSTKKAKEFDCPECNANNPCEAIGTGDEVLCNYCGGEFKVFVTESGRVKLKEL